MESMMFGFNAALEEEISEHIGPTRRREKTRFVGEKKKNE
jgi:hypothetical protein